jgi:poly(beta-D-mannuronate) lyase
MRVSIFFRIAGSVAFAVLPGFADKTVATPNELNAAVKSAAAGETITLKNGAYSNAAIRLEGKGTQGNPIMVKAETPGQVVLTGASTLDFVGEWITLDGFKLEGVKATRTLIVFQDGSKGCRLTNSAILNSNSGDNNWIHVKLGTHHRIDHCRFAGMNQPGMGIQFETSPTVPGDHRVDNCAFVDRAQGSGNGFETVRIGYSHQQDNLSRVTFERNLFLRQNGENEIISNKSTGNLILRNTFADNAGEFTCRHGDKARIEGNFFLRQDRGIRLIGSDHVVVNNYIADMKSDGIVLYSGESNPAPTGYEAATNPIIAFNTIVNCPAGVVVGSGKAVAPKNVRIANNAFLVPAGNAMRIDQAPSGITYEGNLWQGRGSGFTSPGLKQADLKLVKGTDGVWRPEAGSAVADAGPRRSHPRGDQGCRGLRSGCRRGEAQAPHREGRGTLVVGEYLEPGYRRTHLRPVPAPGQGLRRGHGTVGPGRGAGFPGPHAGPGEQAGLFLIGPPPLHPEIGAAGPTEWSGCSRCSSGSRGGSLAAPHGRSR